MIEATPARRIAVCCAVALVAALIVPSQASAAGFAVKIAPPRFELQGKAGDTLRGIVTIANTESAVADFAVRTADWDLNEAGTVTVHPPELRPNSCRPWTRIERHRLRLPPLGAKRYRFEVDVPKDAAPGECRFAILISAAEDRGALAGSGNIRIPVAGQVAVIVYVRVGDAKPSLELETIRMVEVNGRTVPAAVLRNSGNAHGRPEGLLEGKDAAGRTMDFIVSPSPIMPGQTRPIPLWPVAIDGSEIRPEIVLPLALKGPIEWEGASRQVNLTVTD